MGAAAYPYIDLIGQLLIVIDATKFGIQTIDFVIKKIKNQIKYNDIREIAQKWEKENGIHHIIQLRNFVDLKGSWELNKLQKVLGISQEFSIKLLEALGYECIKNQ